jgi:hypothetical protein
MQEEREVTQLHQTIDRMARLLEAHAARAGAQWFSMKQWLEVRVTKCNERHKDNLLWGTGITDMTAEVLAKARARRAALA